MRTASGRFGVKGNDFWKADWFICADTGTDCPTLGRMVREGLFEDVPFKLTPEAASI